MRAEVSRDGNWDVHCRDEWIGTSAIKTLKHQTLDVNTNSKISILAFKNPVNCHLDYYKGPVSQLTRERPSGNFTENGSRIHILKHLIPDKELEAGYENRLQGEKTK